MLCQAKLGCKLLQFFAINFAINAANYFDNEAIWGYCLSAFKIFSNARQ